MKELLAIKHPAVIAFAKAMDEVLCRNDHKGGWKELDLDYLRSRLIVELGEAFVAHCRGRNKSEAKELIDVANFCMMLWNRLVEEK